MKQINEYMNELERLCRENDFIDRRLYDEYDINQGLRDEKGNGVLTGLTNISLIKSFDRKNGVKEPCNGELWYRGYRVEDLIGRLGEDEMGYEKIAYLLLAGELPNENQFAKFHSIIGTLMDLPTNFTRDVIMKAPTDDIMNTMTRSILTLASYDWDLKNTSLENNIRQCLQLISQFPTLAVYAYNAYNHYQNLESMFIHYPDPNLSPAENILTMLRPDKKYTKTEAKVLDTALILHMEHGGGNNSSFTTRVVTSSGSDTYSTIAAAMCSLKGPKHGGANIKVMDMMADISEQINDVEDDEEITTYLEKILDKKVFDRKGLIYGMGHAVYTLSDPREKVLKKYVEQLATEKCRTNEFRLYEQVEHLAPEIIMNRKHNRSGVCPNVDFYSGFVYDMLGIPKELYTAIFAVARIVGWSAHRIEEIVCTDKIIRPAYMSVMKKKE
ncbi:MAG: citrate/2-methylcitrate synthase [Oscillospiraceae bacterium]|nr:citrate/2-methylcitrate synthase [Oscillospiraceae bacterium]